MYYLGLSGENYKEILKKYCQDIFNSKQAHLVFPSKDIENAEDAFSLILEPGMKCYLLFAAPEAQWEKMNLHSITGRLLFDPLASVHLTDFQGELASIHFTIHPLCHLSYNELLNMGRQFLNWLFIQRRVGELETPFVSTLLGYIAKFNKPAIRFSEKLGFERITTIYHGMYSTYKNNYVDSVIMKLEGVRYGQHR